MSCACRMHQAVLKKGEDLKNKEVASVQLAINKLQGAGAQLDSGDVSGASSTLSDGSWTGPFEAVCAEISGGSVVVDKLGALKVRSL